MQVGEGVGYKEQRNLGGNNNVLHLHCGGDYTYAFVTTHTTLHFKKVDFTYIKYTLISKYLKIKISNDSLLIYQDLSNPVHLAEICLNYTH